MTLETLQECSTVIQVSYVPDKGPASQTSAVSSLGNSRDRRYGVPYLQKNVNFTRRD